MSPRGHIVDYSALPTSKRMSLTASRPSYSVHFKSFHFSYFNHVWLVSKTLCIVKQVSVSRMSVYLTLVKAASCLFDYHGQLLVALQCSQSPPLQALCPAGWLGDGFVSFTSVLFILPYCEKLSGVIWFIIHFYLFGLIKTVLWKESYNDFPSSNISRIWNLFASKQVTMNAFRNCCHYYIIRVILKSFFPWFVKIINWLKKHVSST